MAMHIVMIWKLKTKKSNTEKKFGVPFNGDGETIEDEIISVVQKLGVILIICYVPFLVWRLYYYQVVDKRIDSKLLVEEVNILLRNKIVLSIVLKYQFQSANKFDSLIL